MSNLVYVDIVCNPQPDAYTGTRWQGWWWRAINGGNFKVLAVASEMYTNKQDCIDAITELFGSGSNVYLRQSEQGNQELRLASGG